MLNKMILQGRLTEDPRLLPAKPDKAAVANLRLAWDDGDKDNLFINVVIFGGRAEWAAKYFKKGSPILVEGRLVNDEYEDKTSGEKRRDKKIIVDSAHFELRDPNYQPASDAPAAGAKSDAKKDDKKAAGKK